MLVVGLFIRLVVQLEPALVCDCFDGPFHFWLAKCRVVHRVGHDFQRDRHAGGGQQHFV
ncbi:hypothetical protein D3C76_1747880 [compost metagenome]